MTERQHARREHLNHVFRNTQKGRYLNFNIDGIHISCRKFADHAAFVCVNGKPSPDIVFVWED